MARPRNLTPTYAPHKQSGRGRLIWTDTAGARHEKLLPGEYGSEESLAAKARLELVLATSPTRNAVDSNDITVAELMAAYLVCATRYYVDAEGKSTKELGNMKTAIRPVRELYADLPAAEFGPRTLAAARQRMVDSGWCRSLVNHQINRIRRAMKWAASEELIPVSIHEALRTLSGLRRGRTEAKVENQSGCCAAPTTSSTGLLVINEHEPAQPGSDVHTDLAALLHKYDVNDFAASVRVYAVKGRGSA